jgi:H3 lysine-79-specific histone-lysine N-methyltransferase
MGFFDHLQKGGGAFSLQPKKPQIRKVVQTRPANPSRPPPQNAEKAPSRASSSVNGKRTRESASRSASRDPGLRTPKQRLGSSSRTRKRQTPEQRLSSDDDASDTDTSFEVRKRARTGDSAEPDLDRHLRSIKAFAEEGVKPLSMVHAKNVTSVQKAGKFTRAFGAGDKVTEILLQYPSASQKERYGDDTHWVCLSKKVTDILYAVLDTT